VCWFARLREVVIIIWVEPKHVIRFGKFMELFRVQRSVDDQFGHPVEERKSPKQKNRKLRNPKTDPVITAGKLTNKRNNLLESFF
jgi:hypothetical protein